VKLEGKQFTNSSTCHGEAFASEGAPLDMAIIEISGRYPEEGSWARNRECHEMVTVVNGVGSVTVRGATAEQLSAGDTVHIAPGQEFAWDGDMQVIVACSPIFNPEQYDILREEWRK